MHPTNIDKYMDDELEGLPGKGSRRTHSLGEQPRGRQARIRFQADLIEHAEKVPGEFQPVFKPTFKPAEYERYWLLNYLEGFYTSQVITDILWKVKGGKEANVYCCAAHPSTGLRLLAAKVYRPQMLRNLRNDARYRQGRQVVDQHGKAVRSRRENLAVRKNTRFGQELRHESWLESEFQTMALLHAAGVAVPRPLAHGSNVLLMEYIGEERFPAPTLNQISLSHTEANALFAKLSGDLETMLACHRVHADLSAYNILYWEGEVKMIDFPQAVDPRQNPDALDLFIRDVERLCQYFYRFGVRQDPHRLANELWSRYRLSNALDAGAALVEDPENLEDQEAP